MFGSLVADAPSWGVLLGLFLPLATAVVQQPRFTETQRRLIAVVAAVVAGVLTALANGDFGDGGTVLATVTAVILASQASFDLVWSKVGAPQVEAATSPSPSSARDDRPTHGGETAL